MTGVGSVAAPTRAKVTIRGPIRVAPPLVILHEGFYVEDTRIENYGESTFEPQAVPHHE
jgi:hypothetical protein